MFLHCPKQYQKNICWQLDTNTSGACEKKCCDSLAGSCVAAAASVSSAGGNTIPIVNSSQNEANEKNAVLSRSPSRKIKFRKPFWSTYKRVVSSTASVRFSLAVGWTIFASLCVLF